MSFNDLHRFRDLELLIVSEPEPVRILRRDTWRFISSICDFVWTEESIVGWLPDPIGVVPVSTKVLLFFDFHLIFIFCNLCPDLIRQYCHSVSRVNADELFSAKNLPNDLIFVQIIEENGRVPASLDRVWSIFFIIIFAIEFFFEESCEDESSTNLVTGNLV